MNLVVLIGRLTRDPELRYTPNGTAVAQFTLAVDRPFLNQAGEREADFIPIVAWQRLAETCANHLHKGKVGSGRGPVADPGAMKRRMASAGGWRKLWPKCPVF